MRLRRPHDRRRFRPRRLREHDGRGRREQPAPLGTASPTASSTASSSGLVDIGAGLRVPPASPPRYRDRAAACRGVRLRCRRSPVGRDRRLLRRRHGRGLCRQMPRRNTQGHPPTCTRRSGSSGTAETLYVASAGGSTPTRGLSNGAFATPRDGPDRSEAGVGEVNGLALVTGRSARPRRLGAVRRVHAGLEARGRRPVVPSRRHRPRASSRAGSARRSGWRTCPARTTSSSR